MSEINDFPVDMSAAAAYEPYSGLSRDHFSHDGSFKLRIVERAFGKSGAEGKGNNKVDIKFEVMDDDNKGKRTFKSIPLSGVDKDGKPNILQLIGLIALARNLSTEQTRALAGYGANQTASQIVDGFLPIGTEICATIETSYYKGAAGSDVRWFISQDEYAARTKSGSHRVAHKAQQAVATPPAAFTVGAPVAGQPGGFPGMPSIPGLPMAAPSIAPGLPVAPPPQLAPPPVVAAPQFAAPPTMNGALPGLPALPGGLGQLPPARA